MNSEDSTKPAEIIPISLFSSPGICPQCKVLYVITGDYSLFVCPECGEIGGPKNPSRPDQAA